MTAIRPADSGASGSSPRFCSSTIPCRAICAAISLCAFMSGAGAGFHRSIPTANIDRRIRRTMSDRRPLGRLPSA
ncbi:Uncharacterised protein [Mycobacterium tuberculosis]|uniref:Uncharacterized protein n=1 Tax=Mycobacterium tuberculosis TaxID=1773 RepID=A0A0U0S0R6_MYCTX|nr:Uncharacterised protein [Mycobacterium tuberculosis]